MTTWLNRIRKRAKETKEITYCYILRPHVFAKDFDKLFGKFSSKKLVALLEMCLQNILHGDGSL